MESETSKSSVCFPYRFILNQVENKTFIFFCYFSTFTVTKLVTQPEGWLQMQRDFQNRLLGSVTITKPGFGRPDCSPRVTIFKLVLIYFEIVTLSDLFLLHDRFLIKTKSCHKLRFLWNAWSWTFHQEANKLIRCPNISKGIYSKFYFLVLHITYIFQAIIMHFNSD